MLLFKNGIKHLFRDYLQFVIYLVLIIMAVVFTTIFGVVSSSLLNTNATVSKNYKKQDFSYRYTASGYNSNDTATLSPWFAFNTEVVKDSKGSAFPTLTFGDGVLKEYSFNFDKKGSYFSENSSVYLKNESVSSKNYSINFHFGDAESDQEANKDYDYGYFPSNPVSKMNEKEKINNFVAKKEFGDFYKFNQESLNFQNSLIGKVYEKNNNFNVETDNFDVYDSLTNDQKKDALSIFDYMFYLNNSTITDVVKNFMLNKFKLLNESSNGDKDSIEKGMNEYIGTVSNTSTKSTESDIVEKGFNGRIGNIIAISSSTTKEDSEAYFLVDNKSFEDSSSNIQVPNLDFDNSLKNYGSYLIKNYDATSIFRVRASDYVPFTLNNISYTSKLLFNSYYDLVSTLTNFTYHSTSEVVMWNEKGEKFRYISAFDENLNNKDFEDSNTQKFLNPEKYTVYETYNPKDSSFLTGNSFMVSNGYKQTHDWNLGGEYAIFPSKDNQLFRLDAVGVDSLNVYPTIYEEDVLANQEKEAIFYIDTKTFKSMFNYDGKVNKTKFDDSLYQDVSRAYLNYNLKDKTNIKNDINLYQLYAADNITKLNEVSDAIKNPNSSQNRVEETEVLENDYSKLSRMLVEDLEDTKLLNLRSSLFDTISLMFLLISIVFCSLFVLIISFVVYNILKKLLINQRTQLGNLKSLGYSTRKLVMNFVLYMSAPILLITPIGWGIGLGLQRTVSSIFENYFNIPSLFVFDIKILAIEMVCFFFSIVFIVVLMSWLTLRQNSITLLSPSRSAKPNLTIARVTSKIKYVSFISKLRTIIVSVSLKDLFTFFSIIFVSTLILTISVVTPNALTNMTKESYKNIKYNNDYSYSNVLSNNPITRYSFYEMNDDIKTSNYNASVFGAKVKNTDGKYISLIDNDKYWDESNYNATFENMLINNLLTFKGNVLSVDVMNQIVDNINSTNYVKTNVNNLACKVIPTLFGQEDIKENINYDECIKSISNNILPSTVKEMWANNKDSFKNFSFGFGTVPFNAKTDEMYTKVSSVLDNGTKKGQSVNVYGLDKNSKQQNIILENRSKIFDYDKNSETIPVLINQKLKIRGYKVGNTLELSNQISKLTYKDSNSEYKVLDNSLWSYFDSVTNKVTDDISTMDLSHLTYDDTGSMYYFDNGEYKPYNKIQNIKLDISKLNLDPNLLQAVNDEYKGYSNFEFSNNLVSPFEIRTSEDGTSFDKLNLTSLLAGTNSWWNIALKHQLFKTQNFVEKSPIKLKIVGIEDTYDSEKIFVDQVVANEMLGLVNPDLRKTFANNNSINIWSNAKMSANSIKTDQMERIIFQPLNGNNVTVSISDSLVQSVGKVDYVDEKKETMETLIFSVISLSIVFIMISVITSIIMIYLITDLFVGKYKKFMTSMRIQGYTTREISSVFGWIFGPITAISALLGIGTISLIAYMLVPQLLLSLNIAIPLSISVFAFILIFVVAILIFIVAYVLIIKSLFKVKLSSFISVN